MIRYALPAAWTRYDPAQVHTPLVAAKAAVLSLSAMPYQRSWAEQLQAVQLKREVAGTSRIEGAEFRDDKELDEALREPPPADLLTRSQRQAAAAVNTYRWIAGLPDDRPLDRALILEIHRRIVTGADDDHCPPGQLRADGQNVTFGAPRHRGADGGAVCERAFDGLCRAAAGEMKGHDPLVHALAVHYHLAAMHPFLDGNGRSARALEALLLQRQGLRDTLFIAMSNYYYDEKDAYLQALADTRSRDHDLTPFLRFGLRGIELQCRRLREEIKTHVSKALYRDVMRDLFGKLRTPRKRAIAERQLKILELLLESETTFSVILDRVGHLYEDLRYPAKTFVRDLRRLIDLGAIAARHEAKEIYLHARLEWPEEITETEFFERIKRMPRAKTRLF